MKSKTLYSLCALLLVASELFSQSEKNYGSSGGKYMTVDNQKIYYEEYGKGVPLLLLHGGLGSIKDFEKCIGELSKHFRVIAADSPGHGRSTLPDSLTYAMMASYFSKFIDRLEVDSLYVMGWSDGGITALWLAADRSDKVKKIIATGANAKADEVLPDAWAFMNNLSVEAVEAAVSTNEWVKNWVATYKNLSGSKDSWKRYIVTVRKMWLTPDYIGTEKLKRIAIPVLLVYGDHDIVKHEHSLEIFRTISNSQLAILPNTTHAVYTDSPALVNAIAIDFLK